MTPTEALESIARLITSDSWFLAGMDGLPKGKEDEVLNAVDFADDFLCKPILKIICSSLGHEPVQDMYGKPEHDYCLRCGVRTPGEARR